VEVLFPASRGGDTHEERARLGMIDTIIIIVIIIIFKLGFVEHLQQRPWPSAQFAFLELALRAIRAVSEQAVYHVEPQCSEI
jgi:hypothetical protein